MKLDVAPSMQGAKLDTSPTRFGEMLATDADALPAVLRQHLARSGFLLLRGFLEPERVIETRRALLRTLSAIDLVTSDPDSDDPIVARDGRAKRVVQALGMHPAINSLLAWPQLRAWFAALLDGPARPFDYSWLRLVPPGHATLPHADIVYMGAGCREFLTIWIPLHAVRVEQGPLVVLEGSHLAPQVQTYAQLDVDRDRALQRRRLRHWRFVDEGKFSASPRGIQRELGGRWLTTDFEASDVVVFRADLLHGSLDNRSKGTRLSIDTRFQRCDLPFDPRFDGDAARRLVDSAARGVTGSEQPARD